MVRAFTCTAVLVAFFAAAVAAQDREQQNRPGQAPRGSAVSPEKTGQQRGKADPARGSLFDAGRVLEQYDANKDGTLDRSELPPALRERFAQLDTDKDGKLSRDELQKGAAFLQASRRPADVLRVLIEMSDCD